MSPSVKIDEDLVGRLVASQFPHWAGLPISRVAQDGWDNRNFRLGQSLRVRLPTAGCYADQIDVDRRYLPYLASSLPVAIPNLLAVGNPGQGYPWNWGIYHWIDGEIAAEATLPDLSGFAASVARFLRSLQRIDASGGPPPGPNNFFRGGSLGVYDGETRRAIRHLAGVIDAGLAVRIWQDAMTSTWHGPAVWVHGDMTAANLLVRDGRLAAVIDFGQVATGDPACDLALAWNFLDAEARVAFRIAMDADSQTWARAKGWALWKAAIVAAGMCGTNDVELAQCRRTLDEVLKPTLANEIGVASFLSQLASWAATTRMNVAAIALVGSHARGTARSDSDVDVVILSAVPAALLQGDWLALFGEIASTAIDDYGALKSVRVSYRSGLEVEFGIGKLDWAALPLDPGTREVLGHGAAILYDPEGLLESARLAARPSSGTSAHPE